MSGLVKGVKKAFKSVTKVVKKVVKSKIFKVVAVAALAYFGGAAIMSMTGGGTAMGGIQSAWMGITEAGTALASGNVAGAFGSLSAGFTGGAQVSAIAAGAAPGTIAGMQAGAAVVGGTAPAVAPAVAPAASTSFAAGGSLANSITPVADIATKTAAVTSAAPAASTGLLAGLGEAGKAALITGGITVGGQMLQGYAQQKQAEEQAENRDYFGVNGKGDKFNIGGPGLLNISAGNPVPQLKPLSSLDDLIAKQQQTVNAYKQWGA